MLAYLKDRLINHFQHILDGREGFLEISGKLARAPSPLVVEESTIRYTYVLSVKLPHPSLGWTLGEHIHCQEHDATFPHLYEDAKACHFPELFAEWEEFERRFANLGEECCRLGEHYCQQLEQTIKLPLRSDGVGEGEWINYLQLSIFIHERLIGNIYGGLRIWDEAGQSVLQLLDKRCGQASRQKLERCQTVVADVLFNEEVSFKRSLESRDQLKQEAIVLKTKLEKLLLEPNLPGACSYTKLHFF